MSLDHIAKLESGHPAVMVATPMRAASAYTMYTVGMLHTNGLHGAWLPLTGQSDVYVARNVLVNEFLAQKRFQTLVFIDSDIGFTRSHFEALLEADAPIVSGLYPDRSKQPQPLIRDDFGKAIPLSAFRPGELTPAYLVPSGFLKIERKVFETIIEKKLVPAYGRGTKHQFYNGRILFDELASEDYSFCDIVREAGFTPLVHGSIRLDHDGRTF